MLSNGEIINRLHVVQAKCSQCHHLKSHLRVQVTNQLMLLVEKYAVCHLNAMTVNLCKLPELKEAISEFCPISSLSL